MFLSPNISKEGSFKAPTPRGESVNQAGSENISIGKSIGFTVTSKESNITNEYSNFLKKLQHNKSLVICMNEIINEKHLIEFLFELLLKVINFFIYVNDEKVNAKLLDIFKNIMEFLIPCLQALREKNEHLERDLRKTIIKKIYINEKTPESLQKLATKAFKALITNEDSADVGDNVSTSLLNNDFLVTIIELLKEYEYFGTKSNGQ